jgi:hypothetical protein
MQSTMGSRSSPVTNQPVGYSGDIYNDDEEIFLFKGKIEQKAEVDIAKLIRLEIKSSQKVVKLDDKKNQHVPVMVSIKSLDDKKELKEATETAK